MNNTSHNLATSNSRIDFIFKKGFKSAIILLIIIGVINLINIFFQKMTEKNANILFEKILQKIVNGTHRK